MKAENPHPFVTFAFLINRNKAIPIEHTSNTQT